MAHPDASWRVGAIYRCCVRYGMTQVTAEQHMAALGVTRGDVESFKRTCDIWWRNMVQRREEYLISLIPSI